MCGKINHKVAKIKLITSTVAVIGFDPIPCRVNENSEALSVGIVVHFGVLAESVTLQFETLSGTALGTYV